MFQNEHLAREWTGEPQARMPVKNLLLLSQEMVRTCSKAMHKAMSGGDFSPDELKGSEGESIPPSSGQQVDVSDNAVLEAHWVTFSWRQSRCRDAQVGAAVEVTEKTALQGHREYPGSEEGPERRNG